MPRSRVTAKYQVTIPKEVREKAGVRPGETVSVEALSEDKILLKRSPRVSDPLSILIGKKAHRRRVPIEELEARIENE